MNNQKYWEERTILKDKLLEKDINKLEKKLLKLFKDTRKEVLNELKIIYADIEASEYAKYQIDSLLSSINNALDNLYSNNEKEIVEALKDIYKEMDKQASIDLNNAFNTVNIDLAKEVTSTKWGTTLNNYELDKYGMKKGVFATHNEVLEKIVDDLINSNWSGLTLVERIAEHKRKLSLTLKEELSKGLIRGDSLQDMSKAFSKKMDLSYFNALRLIRTESCWVMNEATVNNYKDNGIKEYEFMAFLDKKTSKQCRDLDGKKFSIEEYKAGVNLPPLHPNCRSCIVPIVEDVKKPIKEAKTTIKKATTKKATTKKTTKKPKEKEFKLPKFKKPSSYKTVWKPEMTEMQKEWFDTLTDKEKDNLNKYTMEGVYDRINTGLRKGSLREMYQEMADSMSGALQRNKLNANIRVYRGSSASIFKSVLDDETYKLMRETKVDIDTLKSKLLGNIVNDKGFMSTTLNEMNVLYSDNDFLDNVMLKIDLDKKATGTGFIAPLSEYEDESEVLLDKNTSLYIKDISFNEYKKVYEITCHYLGQI